MRSGQTKILSNLESGEVPDIVIVIGPDGENGDAVRETFEELKGQCKSQGVKYAILGDGKQPITATDLAALPRTDNVVIVGHGSITRLANGDARHRIQLSDSPIPDLTVDMMKLIQDQTGAKNILVQSCYSGRVHEDFKSGKHLSQGTQFITTSAKDETSYANIGNHMAKRFINMVKKQKNNEVSLTEFYGNLLNEIPETINFGIQTQKELQSFTVRREDRLQGNSNDTKRWVKSNVERFNQFLGKAQKSQVSVPDMTTSQMYYYEELRIPLHIRRGDARMVADMLSTDAKKISGVDNIYLLLQHYPRRDGGSKNYKATLEMLLNRDPKQLTKYFKDASKHTARTANQDRNRIILRDLLDIANHADDKQKSSIQKCLLMRHPPAVLLRTANELGLTRIANDLVTAIKISDKDIQAKLKEDGLNLAFGSDKAKNDPAIVLEAYKKDPMSLQYANKVAIDALLKDKSISPDDLRSVEYQKLKANLSHTMSQLNSPSIDVSQREGLIATIKHLSHEMDLVKGAMTPFQRARTDYKDAEADYQKALQAVSQSKADQPEFMNMVEHARALQQKAESLKASVIAIAKGAPAANANAPNESASRDKARQQYTSLQEKKMAYAGDKQPTIQGPNLSEPRLAREASSEAKPVNELPRRGR